MAKRKSRFPSYGLVRGASHAQGGVAGMVAGEQPVELEGGEWIIPKEAVPDYLPVLKQITSEGRAMQQMQNGNSAMDALIASASMENGLTQPKSPMYQTGGVVSDKSWLEDILTDERGFFRGEQPEGTTRRGIVDWNTGTTRQLGGEPYRISVPEAVVSAKGFRAPDFKGETKRFHGVIGMINDMMLKRGLKKEAANLRRELNPYGLAGEAQVRVKTPDGSSGYALEATLPHAETERLYATPGKRYDRAIHDYLTDTRNLTPLVAAEELIKKRQSQPSNIVELLGGLFKGKEQEQGGPVNYYQEGGKAEELVKFRSPLLNKQKYTMTDLMALEAGMPKDEMLVGYDDIRDMDSPRVKALQELAGVLSTNIQGTEESSYVQGTGESLPKYGFEQHLRGKPARSVLGGYSRPGGFDYTIDGIPMIDPVEVRPEYQQGGQMQPRRQKEIRNPEVYGPPTDMMTQMAPDTTGNGLQDMLKQLQMRDVNQSINPFTGDSLDFEGDSLRLLQRMNESRGDTNRTRMPLSPYGQNMQQGGLVGPETYGPPEPTGRQNIEAMQASGMLGQGQPLERRSLMGDANQDSRIAPMPMIEPDQYKIRLIPNAPQDTTMMEIPKLSSAYLASLGVETPLSKRQNSSLQERQIPPQMLNSKVSGLINRALIQRLSKEPL